MNMKTLKHTYPLGATKNELGSLEANLCQWDLVSYVRTLLPSAPLLLSSEYSPSMGGGESAMSAMEHLLHVGGKKKPTAQMAYGPQT
jgi:hypothetical protein